MLLKFSLLCIAYVFKYLFKSFPWIILKTFLHAILCGQSTWHDWFRLFDWLNLQLYSEGKLYSSTSLFSTIAFHIEITTLADGTYELIQEPDGDFSEAQGNIVELTEAPYSDSEEPQSTNSIDFTKGKPQCIILLF